jgi:hypothetical protein
MKRHSQADVSLLLGEHKATISTSSPCMNCMLNTFSGLESVQEMMLPLIILILALIVLIALD